MPSSASSAASPSCIPSCSTFSAMHPDCYFQIFTNGQINHRKGCHKPAQARQRHAARQHRRHRDRQQRAPRQQDVLNRTLRGLRNCLDAKVLTGVATSLCQTNIDDLLTESWLRKLIDMGVHYAWYHTYRPVGPKINARTRPHARSDHPGPALRRRDAQPRCPSPSSMPTTITTGRPSAPWPPASAIISAPLGA
jgi:hypothetical protein